MRLLIYIYAIIFMITFYAWAENVKAPPPLKDEPIAEQDYLQQIYSNFNSLDVVTSDPDSNRNGKKGDMVIYSGATGIYLKINVDSLKTWSGVILSNIP